MTNTVLPLSKVTSIVKTYLYSLSKFQAVKIIEDLGYEIDDENFIIDSFIEELKPKHIVSIFSAMRNKPYDLNLNNEVIVKQYEI